MVKFHLHISIFILFWCVFLPAGAQQADSIPTVQEVRYDKSLVNPPEIDKNDLKAYKNDEAFDYSEYLPKDNWWTQFNNWLNELWHSFLRWILNEREATGILAFLIRALPYLIVAGVLVFLVWLFIKVDMSGSPLLGSTPNQVILNSEEELLKHDDLQQLIDNATNNNNYRLAIRYYYLLVLQNLSKKELITWEVQKTNKDYVYELQDSKLRSQFSKITRIYDFIWYGSFEVNESAFAKAQQEFIKLNSGI
ncbi:DUF4129 domain-containing protein [Flavimarina sp. Hel_I_48]|uniref:DUF4129 domain-containing protein n=1 Tax=Flavimarina sp. Hel_I_48 TaxID=1392488 RepID=UPI0004DFA9B4|nr:DUF4129 domain-containing protein [Flavimarina sp. Hel_I_48]